jgi:ATP-dependent exoDNAse (exonuclease V) beta subunit
VSPQHAPILWCQPKLPPFDQLELVPVKFEKRMGESIFFQEYFQEKINNYIDNLNLLYVAFTRARTALFTWSVSTGKFGNMADVLQKAMEQADNFATKGDRSLFARLADFYDREKQELSIGEISPSSVKEKVKENCLVLDDFRFADFHDYLNLRKYNEHFFVEGKSASTKINKGRIIHEVLAKITTGDDLSPAVNDLVFKGLVQAGEGEQMKTRLQELIADPEVSHWFDGSYRVLNERSVLTGSKHTKRPDRIMLGNNEVIVVDYKSGEMELDKYHSQVRSYMKELEKCGYPNVSGYIWYTQSNKRVKVEASPWSPEGGK